MDDQDLRDMLRPLAREIAPPDVQQRRAAVFAAFDATGGIKPAALRQSLPPLAFVWYLPGAATAGNNVGAEIPLGGDVRLTTLTLLSKTAATSPGRVRITASGVDVDDVSIATGMRSGRSTVPPSAGVRAAGSVLRVDILQAGGMTDVTIVANYTVPD